MKRFFGLFASTVFAVSAFMYENDNLKPHIYCYFKQNTNMAGLEAEKKFLS